MHCHLLPISLIALALANATPVEVDRMDSVLFERRGLQFTANNLFPSPRFAGLGYSNTNVFPDLAFSAGSGQIFGCGVAPNMPCPAPAPDPEPQSALAPEPQPAPAPQPCDQGQVQAQRCPVPAPQPAPAPAPAPAPCLAPAPQPCVQPQLAPTLAPQPVPEPQPAPQPAPQPCDQSQGQECPGASTAPATFNFSNSQNGNLQDDQYHENSLFANNKGANARNVQTGTNTNMNYMGPN
ncbi:hypothetical protein DL89DRAFT_255994 [Linderina pennispora]|uniref:Uncharacterized protein n=1 Tax=Linderina pennispora TaxID=61395 RepID=A0A1Y1WG86_9FUNG|nr:uncharacterized protein DL89DRAFT_255994 [Linderina pennispora]ORX72358.1 hypothetical protein DL89DRAFT_255994 [Linderina pennispora]